MLTDHHDDDGSARVHAADRGDEHSHRDEGGMREQVLARRLRVPEHGVRLSAHVGFGAACAHGRKAQGHARQLLLALYRPC